MKGVGAGARVFWLLDRESAIPLSVGKSLAPERNGPIRFEQVHFTYPSRKEVEVLKGVSLTVEPGTSVALVSVTMTILAPMPMLIEQRIEWKW